MTTLHGIWLPDAFFLFSLREGRPIPVTEWMELLPMGMRMIVSESGKVGVRTFQFPYWMDIGEYYESNKPKLSSHNVHGISLSMHDAVSFLFSLSASKLLKRGIEQADDLLFWQKVSLFTLELLQRGRIVPAVEVMKRNAYGNSEGKAVWKPHLESEADDRRVQLFAAAMPPVCRAYDPKKASGWVDVDPYDIVVSFITQATEMLVREWLSEGFMKEHGTLFRGKLSLGMRWLKALATVDDEEKLMARASEWTKFAHEVTGWTSGQSRKNEWGGNAELRLFFRLESPASVEDASEWTLRFFLQPLDDPSLLIDAADIWKQRTAEMTFLSRRFERVQETLLGHLGRAMQVYPALETVLVQPRPHALALSVHEAYAFLRETAEELQVAGFGLQLPSWWTQRGRRRFGLKLRVKRTSRWATEIQTVASSVLGLDELLEFDAQVALGDETISLEELERLAEMKVPLLQIRGEWTEVDGDELKQVMNYLDSHSHGTVNLGELLHLMAEGRGPSRFDDLPVLDFSMPDELQQMLDGKLELSPEQYRVPDNLHGTLRPYQERGYAWLLAMTDMGMGVCLADDMGLGKTVQLITLLLAKERKRPALIVCPTSLLGNWERELARFAPDLCVLIHHGARRLHNAEFVEQVSHYDVVISSYSLVGRDETDFTRLHWSYLVLDESQNIKNSNSKQAKSVMSFKADRHIALTGTPVENRLSELWSLFQFLNPGYLGSLAQFRTQFALPIERNKDTERAEVLQRLVRPFILRRLKTDPAIITDLPEKIETKTYCALTQEQVSLYQATVQRMLQQIASAEGMQRRGQVLASLTNLKQVCNHPALFLQDNSKLHGRSGKMQRLLEIVTEIYENKDAVLIFTQYVEMGHMLVRYLTEQLGEKPLFLHGGVGKQDRDAMVEAFQDPSGPRVFILSLKAGGVGLTLTRANHVIHFDRWWNPAVENQATDRAFRIGQKKNVLVHIFICQGTLEERIDTLIESKRDLAERVIDAGEKWLTELSVGELTSLLELRDDMLVGEDELDE